MLKPSAVMLDQKLLRKIGSQLREKSEDIYLLYRVLNETGCIAKTMSQMRVGDMKEFISKHRMIMKEDLVRSIEKHMEYLEDDDYFFSGHRSRDHKKPLSKRSYEALVRNIGTVNGVEGLNVKTLSRSYFYGYLRENMYDFSALKKMMKNRGRHTKDLHEFLDFCGITDDEYETDRKKYIEPDINVLQDKIDDKVEKLLEKKNLFADGTYRYEDILETIRMLDAV